MQHLLCIPMSKNNSIDKSCFFYILYFIYIYSKKTGSYPFIYNKFNIDKLRYKDIMLESITNNNALFIFCDDILYSGTQLSEDIISTQIIKIPIHVTTEEQKDEEDAKIINIYLNVVGYTEFSLTTLKSKIYNINIVNINTPILSNRNIILPSNLHPYNNSIKNVTLDFISSKNISLEDFYIDYGMYIITEKNTVMSELQIILLDYLNTHLLYPFYKYPDGLSVYANLCKIFILNDDSKIINMRKLIDDKKFSFEYKPKNNIKYIDNNRYYTEQIVLFLNAEYEKDKNNIEPTYLLECSKLKNVENKKGVNLVITSKLEREARSGRFDLYCEKLSKPFYKKLTYKYNGNKIEINYKFNIRGREIEMKNSFESIYKNLFP